MEERYARLKESCILRGWTDVPFAVANQDTGLLKQVGRDAFYVLNACDGRTNLNSPAFLPGHRRILERILGQGLAEECSRGDELLPSQSYRKADNPLIREVHWAITGSCNMNCHHCFMESPQGRYGSPGWPVLKSMLEQFLRANVLQVSLTGGEPLLCPDFMNILKFLAKEKIRLTEIATNGSLLTRELLEQIKSTGLRPDIKISFDGVGVHDRLRGTTGMEAKVIEGIKAAKESGLNVSITTTVEKNNLIALEDTLKLIKDLKVKIWLIGRSQNLGNWQGNANVLSTEEMAEAGHSLVRCWKKEGQPCLLLLERYFTGGPFLIPSGKEAPGPEERQVRRSYHKDSYECDSLREKPFLLPDGTLLPCMGFTGTKLQKEMPNLIDSNLSDVWRDSSLRAFIDLKKNIVLEESSECSSCGYFSECGAGCRAYALTEGGALFGKDPIACAMYREGFREEFRKQYIEEE